jgi:cytidylate kinase
MKKINIAIDGPVGCGKSVTAKLLAKKLNYKFLDTGLMYRAIGFYLNKLNIDINKVKPEDLKNIDIKFNENNKIILNNTLIENNILKTDECGKWASDYGTNKYVREFLSKKQKEIVNEKSYVAEGRDIGSVVIPDAELKIYLDADILIRAKRRLEDAKKKGENYNLKEMLKIVEQRDYNDKNRDISPLIKCSDAILIDTSYITIEEQVDKLYELAIKAINT